jgi:hypothetical protein
MLAENEPPPDCVGRVEHLQDHIVLFAKDITGAVKKISSCFLDILVWSFWLNLLAMSP